MQIFFENVSLALRVGVHDHERKVPQRYRIDLVINMARGETAQALDQTLDYDQVYDYLQSLQGHEHFELQEQVAQGLATFLHALPGVVSGNVRVAKTAIYPNVAAVGISLDF